MNTYTIIAGVNGTGKSSFRGVLEGQNMISSNIISLYDISKKHNTDLISATNFAVNNIKEYLNKRISFTQETTLSGRTVLNTAVKARKLGYDISLYYIGLNSSEESISRIANRVKKGGHNIPTDDVIRRFNRRFEVLKELIPYCDTVSFYDNENGFVKVAEILNGKFRYVSEYRPQWIEELRTQTAI
jgi:predicted ABC-type ATPase